MTIKSKFINISMLVLSSFLSMHAVHAVEADLCIPFKNAKIDQSLITTMLDAAENGYLYRINSDSSKMGFCVESFIGKVTGDFQKFEGGFALNSANNQTLVSINANSLESDNGFIEDLLKSDSFFNVEKYPELIFVSTGFEWLSETRAVLKGNLTMRGITKAVAFYVEITEAETDLGDSDSIIVKATTTVQRSEFGMYSLTSMVSDRVSLCMSVEAQRYRSI